MNFYHCISFSFSNTIVGALFSMFYFLSFNDHGNDSEG